MIYFIILRGITSVNCLFFVFFLNPGSQVGATRTEGWGALRATDPPTHTIEACYPQPGPAALVPQLEPIALPSGPSLLPHHICQPTSHHWVPSAMSAAPGLPERRGADLPSRTLLHLGR